MADPEGFNMHHGEMPPAASAVQRVAFCAISTASHLQQALVCLESVRRYHPQATCVVLLLQADVSPSLAGISFMHIEDCIPADELKAMRAHYTIAELCFAAKPFLIDALLGSADQVHYLDADCFACSDLEPLIGQLRQADVLLTPHSLTPIPDDGLRPRPLTILRAGAFNAGYIGVRATAEGRRFTTWLSAMTLSYARNDPKAGMCGDQKWLDLAPALFAGLAICRHWGANVAYWNLHERTLTLDGQGNLLANGQPLLFFHFSGFDSALPTQLSKYQDRAQVRSGSPLETLLRRYCEGLPHVPTRRHRRSILRRLFGL